MGRYSRRDFLRLTTGLIGTGAVVTVGGAGYSHYLEPRWVEVNPVRLLLPHLSRAFHGYRLVQISDIHLDGWMTERHLAFVVDTINAQSPDLVVITGDFVTDSPAFRLPELAPLQRLDAPDGVLAVLGNHDYWQGAARVRAMLKQVSVKEIGNAVHPLQRYGETLYIAGVDDVWEKKARLDLVLNQLPADGCAILLAHEPDFANTSAASGRFDLQLSGHSHGGQVNIPFIGPPILPEYGQIYHTGRYQVGSMIQYTNRGLGMVEPRVRFNCRPEITIFTLEAPG